MKLKHIYSAALAACAALGLTACDDNWTRPPMDVPSFPEGLEANITVNEFLQLYWQDSSN